MSPQLKRGAALRDYRLGVAVLVCGGIIVAYFAGTTSDNGAAAVDLFAPQEDGIDGLVGVEHARLAPKPDTPVSGRSFQGTSLATGAPEGQIDFPGPPGQIEGEVIKLLHSQQRQDVDRFLADLDAVAVEAGYANGTNMTVREVQTLHGQQISAQQLGSTMDVVIPGTDGAPDLTVADVLTLHATQLERLATNNAPDEIVIAASDSGAPSMTVSQIRQLHERQLSAATNEDTLEYAAPGPWEGGTSMTVREVRELHDRQFNNNNDNDE